MKNLMTPENQKTISDCIEVFTDPDSKLSNFNKGIGYADSVIDALTIVTEAAKWEHADNLRISKYATDLKMAEKMIKSEGIDKNPALLDELYTHLKNFLENDSKWGSPQKISLQSKMATVYSLKKVAETGSNEFLPFSSKNNYGKSLPGTASKIVKGLKFVKGVGTIISVAQFSTAVVKQIANPSDENFDDVMKNGIGVLTSLIPIPLLDIAANEGATRLYEKGIRALRNSSAKSDILNPFDLNKGAELQRGKDIDVLSPDVKSQKSQTYTYKSEVWGRIIRTGSDTNTELIGSPNPDHIINDNTKNVVINGKEGSDLLENFNSQNVTMRTAGSNNFIVNVNSPKTFITTKNTDNDNNPGEGKQNSDKPNDESEEKKPDSVFYVISSDQVTVETDNSNNFVDNFYGFSNTVVAGSGDDSIVNWGSFNDIIAGDGDNNVNNTGSRVSIQTGAGNDTIDTFGDSVKVQVGTGDDSIYNSGNNVTINAGDGNDSIYNEENSSRVSIVAGKGKDYIENFGDNNTIITGEDDDVINNVGENNFIDLGAGADYLENFNDSNTIDGGAGDDIIVSIGEKNSLSGNTGNDNISNVGSNNTINAGAGDDTVYSSGDNVTVEAGAGNDVVDNSGSGVKIYGGADNDTITSGEIYYSDLISPFGDSVTVYSTGGTDNYFDGGEGNDVITNTGKYVYDSSTQRYTLNSEPNNSTLLGGAGNDTIYNQGTYVTIDGGSGADSIRNIGDFVTIDGGNDNDSIENTGEKVSINGGNGDDIIRNEETKNSSLKVVKYPDSVTISGGSGNDQISNYGRKVLVDGGADDDYIINGYPDGLGKGSTVLGGAGNDTLLNYADDVSINVGNGSDYLANYYGGNVTIDGGAGNDTVNVSGENVRVNIGAGNNSIFASCAENLSINTGDGEDTIVLGCTIKNSDGEPSYYNLANNVSVTVGAGNKLIKNNGGENLNLIFTESANSTISGFNATSTLILGNGKDTYSKTSLDNGDLKIISGNKEILLTADAKVSNPKIIGEELKWRLSKTTATYGTAAKSWFNVTGVQSLDGISLDEGSGVVTISKAALKNTKVTISKGYTLKLDSDVEKPLANGNFWQFKGTTATLSQGISAGYNLAKDGRSITYSKATAGKTIATLSGLKKNANVSDLSANTETHVITLSSSVLGTSNVKLSGNSGYILELGADVMAPVAGESTWRLKGTTATLSQGISAGYTLSNDGRSVAYKKATAGTTVATISGLKKNSKAFEGGNVSDNSISISGKVLSNKVGVSGNYAFHFEDDYNNASITGSKADDFIAFSGSNLTVSGGKGNDYLVNEGSGNTFVYATGDGNDVIANFTENDKIKISKGSVKSVKTDGGDVVISVGTGTITLEDAAGQDISINNKIYQTAGSNFSRRIAEKYWFLESNSLDTLMNFDTIQNVTENFAGQLETTTDFNKLATETFVLAATENRK